MKFFLNCDKAVNVCDKSQYNEASFIEKLLLKLHILLCKLCRGHVKRNVKLTKAIKSSKIKTLATEEKQQLKNKLRQEIENDNHS